MSAEKIKVLIVDDQALILDILSKGLSTDPQLDIVGTATDGYIALNRVRTLKPDVIILDMEMPRMNGIQFLHNLMPSMPTPTIVLSALTDRDSKLTLEAFEAGAVDFLQKPSGGARALPKLISLLRTKIRVALTKEVKPLRKAQHDYKLPPKALDRTAKTQQIILGMGDFEVTNEPGKILKIFALGSCIGLGMFCPSKDMVGLAHVALPTSKTDPEKAIKVPGYFGDSAVTAMLDKFARLGCSPNMIYAKIAGGAKTKVELGDHFNIGQRNAVSVKASLLKNRIKTLAEDVGGNISRTASITVGDKKMTLYYPDKGNWQI